MPNQHRAPGASPSLGTETPDAPQRPQRPQRPRTERHLGRAFAVPCVRAGPGLHFPACRGAERPRPAVSGSRRLIAAAADEPSPRAGGGAARAAPCRRPAHYARPGGWRWKVRAPRPRLAVSPRGPSPVSSPGRSPAAGPAGRGGGLGAPAPLCRPPRLASPPGPVPAAWQLPLRARRSRRSSAASLRGSSGPRRLPPCPEAVSPEPRGCVPRFPRPSVLPKSGAEPGP